MSDEESARIIGFRATGGPLYQASFPIQRGLTVLYGLNGSGKTHLLNALHSVLSGRRVGLDGEFCSPYLDAALLLSAPEEHFSLWRSPTSRGDEWREWHRYSIEKYAGALRYLHRQIEDEGVWELRAPEPRTSGTKWKIRPAVTPCAGTPAGRIWAAEGAVWTDFVRLQRDEDFDLEKHAKELLPSRFGGDQDRSDELPEAWVQGLFVDGDAVFFSVDEVEPPDDGLPIPVVSLDGMYRESTFLTPIDGLRVLVESADPEASNDRTRRCIGLLGAGRLLPSDSGWQTLPSREQVELARAHLADDAKFPVLSSEAEDEYLLEAAAEDVARLRAATLDWKRLISVAMLSSYFEFLEELSNEIYCRFLLGAPKLELAVNRNPFASFAGRQLEWESEGRPLAALSKAQKRWADLAIALALEATLEPPENASIPRGEHVQFQPQTFVLIDEPEAALHRTAEAHMVRGLEWLGCQPGMHVVVATHSPHLIDSRSALVARVHSRPVVSFEFRTGNRSLVSPLTGVHRSDLELLGLEPSDLLGRSRVMLLVEGQHDEVVIREFLSRALNPSVVGRIELLPVRGARNLPMALDSRLLFDFTDATIIPIVDNVRAEHVIRVWDQALVIAAADGAQEGGDFLRRELPAADAAENGFLSQFLSRAIAIGVQSRVSPFSVPAVDVTDYLPVGAFVPKVKSWGDMRAAYRAEVESGATRLTNFKSWVEKKYRTDFSDDRIRTALAQVEGCPEDFQALADLCARLCE